MKTISSVTPCNGMIHIQTREWEGVGNADYNNIELLLEEARSLVLDLNKAIEAVVKYTEQRKAARIIELENSIRDQTEELSKLKG